VGVNTFLREGGTAADDTPLTRASKDEKDARLAHLRNFQQRHAEQSAEALSQLQDTARSGGNLFEQLLTTVQSCSLGQISNALYEVGGRYRRSM